MRTALLTIFSLAIGCSPYYWQPTDDSCSSASSVSQVAGEWTIQGFGSRSKCLDNDQQRYGGDFVLGPSLPLAVDQTVSATQATVHALNLTTSLGSDFSFYGSVQGSCVNFETEEQSEGESIRYTFKGQATSATRIEGSFSGTGPDSCRSSGDFTVIVRVP